MRSCGVTIRANCQMRYYIYLIAQPEAAACVRALVKANVRFTGLRSSNRDRRASTIADDARSAHRIIMAVVTLTGTE